MNFFESMANTANTNVKYSGIRTENGAISYATTGKKLLDFNFKVSSFRNETDEEIVKNFSEVYKENKQLAIIWLFFARDVRGGLGERRLFRLCLEHILKTEGAMDDTMVSNLCSLCMEYGRADDIYTILECGYGVQVAHFIIAQLKWDIINMQNKKPVSLLAKWLKSEKASSKESKKLAFDTMNLMGWSPKKYRTTLSALRAYIDVTEIKMSKREWTKIDYSAVPSRAGMIYKNAFIRHDEEGYNDWIERVSDGKATINAGALYPYEIVHKYNLNVWGGNKIDQIDQTLEEMWKALPITTKDDESTLVVADGSGSMTSRISGSSNATALDVANSLAIYFAEKAKGVYKDKYITFSEHPEFVDFSNKATLLEKLEEAFKHNEVANTNIEAVFDLILDTAIDSGSKQEDLPKNILIISDMEFDEATEGDTDKAMFDNMKEKYQKHGYSMPRLVFWNVCSRTGAIPVQENENGVCFVSGFSQNVADMVMSNETDPMKCLLKTLNGERYKDARDFAENFIKSSMLNPLPF